MKVIDKNRPLCKCGKPAKCNGHNVKGERKYCKLCNVCAKVKYKDWRVKNRRFKKDTCERCGFVPENSCQLDLDHIDGNSNNYEESNLQTLCANCHRLKTFNNQDWKPLT